MSKTYDPKDYQGPREFVHLHNHTCYSCLDGVALPNQYGGECVKRGYPAMSATEHGHMASVPDMYLAFRKCGVKYIPACEIYYNDYEPVRQQLVAGGVKIRSKEWRDANPDLSYRVSRNRHLTVLCKNQTGFTNLLKLTTQAYATGLFGMGRVQYNRIWFDKLCEFKEGLIILSGCLNGPISHELRYEQLTDKEGNVTFSRTKRECDSEALKLIKKFQRVFGDDFYIEAQMPGIPDDDKLFRRLVQMADLCRLPLVLTNDCHYLRRDDFILQKIMMAVEQETTVDSPDLFHVNSDEQYMKSRAELWATFKNGGYSKGIDDRTFEAMCDNTLKIAEKCQPLTIDTEPKIPDIANADNKLRQLVATALKERGLDKDARKFVIDGREVTYMEQARIELNRFIDKGFSSYFLITRDLIQFGRSHAWPFSPRGSAGGSLVCFLIGISTIDPLLWGLSFDRFLSPSRGGYMLDLSVPKELV